jgi:ribosomal-protein-alanine N-acetyltransferase
VPGEPLGVEIVAMERSHLRVVAELAKIDLHPPWSIDTFRRELEQGERRCYVVARSGRRIVGFAGLLLTVPGAEAHITIIGVTPDERGRGVGRQLLAHLAAVAIERGADALTLEVRPTNEPAMALYRRFGFAPEGVRKGYYADVEEDALILWARDIQGATFLQRLGGL